LREQYLANEIAQSKFKKFDMDFDLLSLQRDYEKLKFELNVLNKSNELLILKYLEDDFRYGITEDGKYKFDYETTDKDYEELTEAFESVKYADRY